MFFKRLLAVVLVAVSLVAEARQLGGIEIPEKVSLEGAPLVLNGAGIREKFFFELYVGGLYLQNKSEDASKIMSADEPMSIRLHIISNQITSERMVKATSEGFAHATRNDTGPISDEIASFLSAFREPIKTGDVFEMNYLPSSGTQIVKNGNTINQIEGLRFKEALFGIWLCHEPAQEDLREGMLGRL